MLVNIYRCCFEHWQLRVSMKLLRTTLIYCLLFDSPSCRIWCLMHTHSSVLTHLNWGRWLREMVRYVCVCVCMSVYLSVCLSVCLWASVCVHVCVCVCVWCPSYLVCVCVCVSCCICIVCTWMSRCLLSWHGMIYVCTCECVYTLPVCLSVRVCVQVTTVCVCVCMSVNSTCCAHVVDSPADL